MKRRELLVLGASAAIAWPYSVRARTAKRRRIAYLAPGSRAFNEPPFGRFRQGLRALSYGDEVIE